MRPSIKPQPDKLVLELPTPERWKAELTLAVAYIPRWFICPQKATHPGSNHSPLDSDPTGSWTHDLMIESPTSYRYITKSVIKPYALYMVGQKSATLLLSISSPIDDFQNSFTGSLCKQFAIMWLL